MLGMEIRTCSTLLGDNNYVILNTLYTFICCNKSHNSVAFHKSKEAIASVYLITGHIGEKKYH